jgi:hypothetical protein
MSKKTADIKKVITDAVLHTTGTAKGRKSSGTKVASVKREITTTVIDPFSR